MKLNAPLSIVARLVLLFAAASVFTLTAVGAYLYHSLAHQLETRDDEELLGKIRSIAHLVKEAGSVDAMRRAPHIFLDATLGHDKLLVEIKTTDNGLSLTNPGTSPLVFPKVLTLQEELDKSAIFTLDMGEGESARAVACELQVAKTGEIVQVMVARLSSDRMALLGQYRMEIWICVCAAIILATVLSYFLVKRGLSPLRQLAMRTREITVHKLDTQIELSSAPPDLQIIVRAFNEMLNRLHSSFENLTQFSADLAHDLRTPLNNLMIQTQVALGQVRSVDEYQALLGSNLEEFQRLTRMTESMLFIARAENASIVLQREQLDLPRELQKIADYFEGLAEENNVSIEVTATSTLAADPILLRRAVGNLVANALRYTPSGERIRITVTPDGDALSISVANPGAGIDPEQLSRIFDRFYRADPSRVDSANSAGLGLAIVKSIMSLHGGTVSATCTSAGITIFTLSFPLSSPA
ncbi:heavy metal sensor histidine kinase [Herbaspirillum aquaticum]|uniref:Sensor protein n=1 Tax=Herbaspirillum aquaticum TaxID=568783 RepID=A0A225SZK8_9BURK|nr:heavy metal sensor histidine kinase [Herbaspirillum aquaticum]OWY36480.1 two-component sensor histidine kinase [Herbaspirillum aquaticum]